jgi:hypothetical protein
MGRTGRHHQVVGLEHTLVEADPPFGDFTWYAGMNFEF